MDLDIPEPHTKFWPPSSHARLPLSTVKGLRERTAKTRQKHYLSNQLPAKNKTRKKKKRKEKQAKPKLYAMKTRNKIRRFIGRLIVSKHNIFTELAFAHSANGTT